MVSVILALPFLATYIYPIFCADAVAFLGSRFGEGSGPIFLDNLVCNSKDTLLLDCSKRSQVGLFSCDHSEIAGARCHGMSIQHTYLVTCSNCIVTLTTLYVDIDECDLGMDGCAHNCTNVIGSYVCSCMSGYVLDIDEQDCIGKRYPS